MELSFQLIPKIQRGQCRRFQQQSQKPPPEEDQTSCVGTELGARVGSEFSVGVRGSGFSNHHSSQQRSNNTTKLKFKRSVASAGANSVRMSGALLSRENTLDQMSSLLVDDVRSEFRKLEKNIDAGEEKTVDAYFRYVGGNRTLPQKLTAC